MDDLHTILNIFSLLFAYTENRLLENYTATVLENWAVSVTIDQKQYTVNLFDTAGQVCPSICWSTFLTLATNFSNNVSTKKKERSDLSVPFSGSTVAVKHNITVSYLYNCDSSISPRGK